jgi:hypothetical protein
MLLFAACKSSLNTAKISEEQFAGLRTDCKDYFPGKQTGWKRYSELLQRLRSPYPDYKYSYSNYVLFLKSVEQEFLCAVNYVFSNPAEANVIYGSFSDGPGAKDGGEGLRVIWSRPIARGKDLRLINVIMFWNYDPISKKFALKNGPDALRIRLQLTKDAEGQYGRPHYGALSFGLKIDNSKTVAAIYTAPMVTVKGLPISGHAIESSPDMCAGCHSGSQISHHLAPPPTNSPFGGDYRLELDIDYERYTSDAFWGLLDLYTKHPEQRLNAEFFKTPKQGFYPKGLLNSISARLQKIQNAQ